MDAVMYALISAIEKADPMRFSVEAVPAPTPSWGGCIGKMSDTEIVKVCGYYPDGSFQTKKVEAYNVVTKTWRSLVDYTYQLVRGMAGTVPGDGMLHIVGGYITGAQKYHRRLNAAAWESMSSLPVAVSYAPHGAYGDFFYVLTSTEMYRYDRVTNTWSTDATKGHGEAGNYAAGACDDRYVYFYIPQASGSAPTRPVKRFDMATETWEVVGQITEPRFTYAGSNSFVIPLGDKVAVGRTEIDCIAVLDLASGKQVLEAIPPGYESGSYDQFIAMPGGFTIGYSEDSWLNKGPTPVRVLWSTEKDTAIATAKALSAIR